MSSLSAADRATLLSSWIKPSSDNEKTQQDCAERMIADAIKAHPAFSDIDIRVFAKGSYANNTNVRRDSDVDIVVENRDCFYYEFFGCDAPPAGTIPGYSGQWTPDLWRREVTAAIVNYFGRNDVDTSGSVALAVSERPGSRPSADVVPSFQFHRYDTTDRSVCHEGTRVFKKGSSSRYIDNWPQQQLNNGRAKNTATSRRYKNYARALKNAENYLVKAGAMDAKPSYLMECLAWNVPNSTLSTGDLDGGFRSTLVWLWEHLNDQYKYEEWDEPNGLKYLFCHEQKWTRKDAQEIVLKTWDLLDY
ncbi:hypothetical protein [Klenkia brasiliensis]|uniref:cGAS/DncV-like nucleotidyltransferase C-terminal helical domain-containing protein n=1 Tax=Klenkia brasiliensis TaxID=333142 RepID=A0A1G7SF35_9ACTN|nr:hypothetical protein [Klenkia brasiliensis]SDG21613.1 hypothetical protein SAMN05660324_1999 [Klenkia brasiliensis]